MFNLALTLFLCIIVICVILCLCDIADYREEFPNGDPNVGAELPSDAWVAECSDK